MMCTARRLSCSLTRRTELKYWVTLLGKSEKVLQSPVFLEAHGNPSFAMVWIFWAFLVMFCCAPVYTEESFQVVLFGRYMSEVIRLSLNLF